MPTRTGPAPSLGDTRQQLRSLRLFTRGHWLFTGEPLRIDLNSDKPIFRPPHKLGQVEWDFVQAQCQKLEALGFIQRSTQYMYASATVVVRKKDAEGNYTDFRQCGDYRPLNLKTTLDLLGPLPIGTSASLVSAPIPP